MPNEECDIPQQREWANQLTHGLGTILALGTLAVMVPVAALKGTARHVVGTSIFGASLVVLYAMSTLYHASRNPRLKHIFHVLDHAAIFVLIAGTYTPFCLVTLQGAWGWSLFGTIWGLAISGILIKAILGPNGGRLSTAVYLTMGWLVLIAIVPLARALPFGGWAWLLGGGLCYSVGVLFYTWERLAYHHAIWHLFVLAGSACHVVTVLAYVIPW